MIFHAIHFIFVVAKSNYIPKNTGFTGALPRDIGNLANLTLFTANNNQISGALPASLGDLTDLLTLTLTSTGLSGQVPESLCGTGADIQVDCEVECTCCTNYNC